MRNKLIVGAGVHCLINGVNVGIVSGINWTFNTARDEERGIDALTPFELSPNMVSISVQVQVYRVRDDAGLKGYGIVEEPMHIDEDFYFTLELKDRVSGATYLKVTQAAVDSQTWGVNAKGVMQGSFACHGLTGRSSYRS